MDYCGQVVVKKKKDLVLTYQPKYFSHGVLYVFREPDYYVSVCVCDQCI